MIASISSSITETWKTATAASTQQVSQEATKAASGGLEIFQPIISAMVNASAKAFDRPNSQVYERLMLQQGRQVDRAQNQMYNVAMSLAQSSFHSLSNSNLREPAPAAASFAQPQAQLDAPAQPQSKEAGIASWLKSKGIAHDDQIVEELIEQGVEVGEDVVLMSEEDWQQCGFKKVALTKLAKEKARSV